MPDDPFVTLGVKRGATDAEIKAAYRSLAALYHPDRNPGFQEAANEKLKVLNDAYARVKAADGDQPAAAGAAAGERNDADDDQPSGGHDHQKAVAIALVGVGIMQDAERDHPIAEAIASLLPGDAQVSLCVPSVRVPADQYGFREARRTFLRRPSLDGVGAAVGPWSRVISPVARMEAVLCTVDAMVWTSSRVADADGVVVQEHVTAYSLAFASILGSRVTRRRKGTLDVWVMDGPTLTFLIASPQEAEALSAYVNTASAAQ